MFFLDDDDDAIYCYYDLIRPCCMSLLSFESVLRIIDKILKVLSAAIKALGIDDDESETAG